MADEQQIDIDIDLAPPSRPRGGRLLAILGLLLLVALGGFAIANAGGSSPDGTTDRADPDDPDDPDDPEPVAVDAAGRYDGLDSVRLPLEVTPDTDLVDGSEVRARGAGYTPNATVAIVQCAGIVGPERDGSVDNCDLSNYLLGNADENGYVDMTLIVRRYIGTGEGEMDCALSSVDCAIAIGNIDNYDESGVANAWFDGNVEGVRSPVITVTPTVGIRDGDQLTVVGANFEPNDEVRLGQCVIGGAHSFSGCFSSGYLIDTVMADADGAFTAVVTARRELGSGIDCFDDVYGCRLAAHGTTDAPNPVGLFFDGSTRPASGVSLVLDPGFDLFDGAFVTVSIDEVARDGELFLQQCVDQGDLGVTCGPEITTTVIDGSASTTYVIEQFLVNGAGDSVDCAADGRVCEFRVSGVHEQTVPLRFRGEP
ncbi:MAG: neocarzinostatin apoprotein domain-containing protein [Acidimicrobiales bacterium]